AREAQSDRHRVRDARCDRDCAAGELRDDHLAPVGRNRGHDHRRSGRGHVGRPDQNWVRQPQRSRRQVQPAAANRGRARLGRPLRGPRGGPSACDAGVTVYRLVVLRHGESTWNEENRFTGWTDVDLTEKGRTEAREAGRLMRAEGFTFDLAFTSVLKRAIRTLWIALEEMDLMWIPEQKSWRLNERHYGALQGLNKAETAAKHGELQVK